MRFHRAGGELPRRIAGGAETVLRGPETGRSIPPYVVEQAKIVLAKAEEETEFFG
jgi:hypothetical protein